MSSMVQGDAYSLDVTIKNNGSPINISDVKTVEFTLFNFKKIYPGDAEYSDGKFHIPLCQMQVRVKFKSGDVIGSEIKQIDVAHALSKAVL